MSPKRFTAKDLADVRVPEVDQRLQDIRETLALVMMLARGCERADDLCMSEADARAAWTRISSLTDEAMASLNALDAALPNDAKLLNAPDVNAGGR